MISFSSIAQDQEQIRQQQQLAAIQQQISEIEQQLKDRQQSKESLQKQVKNAELLEAKLAKAINATKTELATTNQSLRELTEQQQQLNQKVELQRGILAKTIASAYRTGGHDFSKMLLNIESPAELERMLGYYRYLNRARMEQLASFNDSIAALAQVNQELLSQQQKLRASQERQNKQYRSQQANRQNRQKALNQLDKTIATDQQRLVQLQEDEMRLAETLERLQQQAQVNPELNGLKQVRGKLPWPYKAKIQNRFGGRKQGEIRWKGVVLNGKIGDNVRSIARGRIVYADWLNGFGLLVVIDHGEGFMSLYGYNQAIIGDVGDIVEAGEAIALIGQSGGQSQAGLYFEIRHKGVALNPSKWCK